MTSAVHAHAAVVAERRDGRSCCTSLRSAPPLTLRDTPDGVFLVGSAAGPLGGDDLRLDVAVGVDTALTVRSAAASLVLPGPIAGCSRLSIDLDVGAGAMLSWLPEPTVLVQGCDHRTTTTVRLAEGAGLVWREEVVLGRHDEPTGSVLQRLRVDVAGRPLVRNDLALGPRWSAGVEPYRCVGMLLVVGPDAEWVTVASSTGSTEARVACMPLDGPAILVSVVAARPGLVRSVLDDVSKR